MLHSAQQPSFRAASRSSTQAALAVSVIAAELPGSLESALVAFEADTVLRQALDERFSDYYVTSRRWEVKAFRETVTEWERDRYMRTV